MPPQYFRLYFHYMYFNVGRSFYFQADNIIGYFILVPTIAAGAITFGILQQILTAFGQVSNSFQLIVNAWPTVIELISIHKRLWAFESVLKGTDLPQIDQDFLSGRIPKPKLNQGGWWNIRRRGIITTCRHAWHG